MWSSTTIRLPFTSAPQLAGQGGAACHAQRHEHAGDFQCPAVFQLHAGDPLLAEDGFHGFRPHGHLRRELCRQRGSAREQGDAVGHGQQGLYLVQGVLSTAQHGHIPAAVEKASQVAQ